MLPFLSMIHLLLLAVHLLATIARLLRPGGNRQTVEVRHVHIYPGAQGVVGIVNTPGADGGRGDEQK